MKKLFKFGCLGVIALVVLGIIITSLGGDDTNSSNSDGGNEEATSNEENSEEKEQTYSVGDTVEVGAMTYTVNEVSTADEVGMSMAPTEANGKYVILNMTVKNNGDESATIDSSYFTMKYDGKTFDADSTGSIEANMKDDGSMKNSFFMEQLNPGSELTGNVAFDVAPEIAEADGLKLEASEGIFGTNTKIIDLR
ncbi:DUF4352 domain-containing protein [Halobacillus litoralis]|uniref:DUF4352 domain-containing protein n=1 Tax=Halobacillus litoralis TaxID=45668 RepID=UPI002490F980|nr:DUF4352 domain-containing protein [Halobacillus litoralis]